MPGFRVLALVALCLTLVGLTAGCGSTDQSLERSAAQQRARALRDERERSRQQRERTRRLDAAAAKSTACQGQAGELVKALDQFRTRVSRGLDYETYVAGAADLKLVLDRGDFAGADADCTKSVVVPAQTAADEYAKATTTWDRCFGETGCDDLQTALSKHWDAATQQGGKAADGLRKLEAAAHPRQ